MNEDDMYDAFERDDRRHAELLDRVKAIEATLDVLFPEGAKPSLSTVDAAYRVWRERRPS